MPKNYWLYFTRNSHWLLIITGSVIWSLTMVKSGLVYDYGIGFWGPNGHDGIWHMSLVESLSRFSLQMPIFAGESLRNYHFGYDLILSFFHLLLRIPSSVLYFQVFPPLLAVGIGYYAWKFLTAWTKNSTVSLLGLYLIYFGGSFGWLVNLIRGHGWGGESMFWAQQSISTLINPPFALSLLIIFFVLYRIASGKTSTNHQLLTTSFLIGSLAFIKIYAVILFLPGLAIASLKKPELRKLFIYSLCFSLLFYLPFNRGAGSLIVWQPFWFLEHMLALSDRFFWPKLYEAMIVYKTTRNIFKFIPAYTLAAAIFLVGNLGIRILGLADLVKFKKLSAIELILWTMAGLGLIIPMLFVQKGTPWNTIQFFYYTQFIMGIFTAVVLSKVLNFEKFRIYLGFGILSLVFLLTIPTTIDTLRHYLPSRPPAMISREEASALKFLRSEAAGVIFTPPADPDPYYSAPRPLYKYESTAYVSAYTGKPVYLEDTVNLDITGYPWKDRRDQSIRFLNETDLAAARLFLESNKINYIYLPEVAFTRPYFSASQLGGRVIFENSQVSIWEIK